jgi:ABC-type antimicrobial peptide transport system permease subunit
VAVRAAIEAVDADLPVPAIDDMETIVSASIAQPRFLMTVLARFASAALVLSALGIYGVMAYPVVQRTFEIGVRIALAAKGSDVLAAVLRRAMVLVGTGVGGGLLAAYWLTRSALCVG